MIYGVKRTWESPFFCLKKQHCPECGQLLKKVKISNVVNSFSKEAKDYNFSSGGSTLLGNVKFIHTEFLCDSCNRLYTVRELKEWKSGEQDEKGDPEYEKEYTDWISRLR